MHVYLLIKIGLYTAENERSEEVSQTSKNLWGEGAGGAVVEMALSGDMLDVSPWVCNRRLHSRGRAFRSTAGWVASAVRVGNRYIPTYSAELARTKGIMPEFVNPK